MIHFNCPGCGRPFKVEDDLAGRSARCKGCGNHFHIPKTPALSELEAMLKLEEFPVRLKDFAGDPPTMYLVEYTVRGIEKLRDDRPVIRDWHLAEITPPDGENAKSVCRIMTPIFHPNIDAGIVALDAFKGNGVAELALHVGRMLAYQEYDLEQAINQEAAAWVRAHSEELPLDPQKLESKSPSN